MAHIINALKFPCVRAYYRRKALIRRLHAVVFFDYLDAQIDALRRNLAR